MSRFFALAVLLGLPALPISGEEEAAPRAVPWARCQTLCANLATSIQERPDMMVMRLEDALVIDESCAAEIVTAAIDAVRAKPAMVEKILQTAIKIVPARSTLVMEVVHSYTPASDIRPAIVEEVLPAATAPAVEETAPAEEIRRAELPAAVEPTPIEEIRRAEVPAASR